MEIVFRNMATVVATAKFRVTVRGEIKETRRVLGVVFLQCDRSFQERKVMKQLLSVLSVFALAAIAAGTASAGSIYTPTGLNPGDQFRFVFLSTTTTTATSSDLSSYDSIVSSDATGYTYGGTSPIWQAIVSNTTISVSDHIGLQATSLIPIYTADGAKVSTGNLWSGDVLSPINIIISGTTLSNREVWTGSNDDGTIAYGVGPSPGYATKADADSVEEDWIAGNYNDISSTFHIYGISDVLTVPATVPEPSTAMLAGLGGLAALVYSFKRKRN
jgi:hypothetical protein